MEEVRKSNITIAFTVDWKCGEDELLKQCKACETYEALHKVLNDNMIIYLGEESEDEPNY